MKRYPLFMFLWLCLLTSFGFGDDAQYSFSGRHFIASYTGCNHGALSDVGNLKEAFLKAVDECGATLLDSADYIFPPDGMTMVALLSESHASIHTYPEHDACFVDLFTCGTQCSAEKFDEALRAYLLPENVIVKVLSRNKMVEEER